MIKQYFRALLILFATVVVESAILSNIYILPCVPDILLIFTVYLSILNGKTFGELSGFSSGLIMDFFTGVPYGFNTLLRTLIGYIFGNFHKKVIIGRMFIPMVSVGAATLVKALLTWLITILFPLTVNQLNIFSQKFLFELCANIILAPIFFRFIGYFRDALSTENIQDLKDNV
ncbi:MAG: rod shape-determining protein MreD [Treponema sp.]|nr:rod shape-determining protein MreD [Treponema sp.]